jgi:hypothetical protein
VRPSPESSGSTEKQLGGWGSSDPRSARDASGLGGSFGFLMGLARPAFGPAATRRSGLRAGDRPGSRKLLRELVRIGRTRQPLGWGRSGLFGGLPSGTGSRVCPADPGFRREGAGRTSALTFPARTASLPRVGEPDDPGPRGFREETARRSQGRGRRLQGCWPWPGKLPREGSLSGDLEKTGGWLRAAARPDGILRDPARAPGRALAPLSEACLTRGRRGWMPERRPQG